MNILDCIGDTPLLHLDRISRIAGANIYVKVETHNPGGSIKDRAAMAYIQGAIRRGELAPGGCIVEATSGNLGIGLATICSKLDIRMMLCMPASVSKERISLLRALGAEVIITPPEQGMQGALDKAAFHHEDTWGSFRPDQFNNPDGPQCHYETTGVEILNNCKEQGVHIDAFVTGIGSGATFTGVGRRLRENDPAVFLGAVEPAESAVLSGKNAAAHGIQGIGAGFVPAVLDRSLISEVLAVDTRDAIKATKRLIGMEGISAGISSGANVHAALMLAQRPEFKGKNIVTIVCDAAERYMSTELFDDYWAK